MTTLKMPNGVTWDYEPTPLAGRTAIVTGGTTGIGRATVLLLAVNGVRVLTFGRHQKELDEALADFAKAGLGSGIYGQADPGKQVTALTADVARPDDLRRVFAAADELFGGRLDVLINNAGVAAEKLADLSPDDIDYVIRTNVSAVLVCTKFAAERMTSGGHVVNVGSMSAEERGGGSPVYVASKAAVRGMTASLAKGLREQGIKATLIEPGATGADIQKHPEENAKLADEDKRMKAEDVAVAIAGALTQPSRCTVLGVQLEPHLKPA